MRSNGFAARGSALCAMAVFVVLRNRATVREGSSLEWVTDQDQHCRRPFGMSAECISWLVLDVLNPCSVEPVTFNRSALQELRWPPRPVGWSGAAVAVLHAWSRSGLEPEHKNAAPRLAAGSRVKFQPTKPGLATRNPLGGNLLSLVLSTHARPEPEASRSGDANRSGVRRAVEVHRLPAPHAPHRRCVAASSPCADASVRRSAVEAHRYRRLLTWAAAGGVFLAGLLLGVVPAVLLGFVGLVSRASCSRGLQRTSR
jgi:hypothetical protein